MFIICFFEIKNVKLKTKINKKIYMSKQKLNIVDDNDKIIGVEDRNTIHKKGLLHREVHVYFITPEKQIIFQHRAKDKDTFPDLLDATVGGHVEIGDDYIKTAVKETLEETGMKINYSDLIPVSKIHKNSTDNSTGKINHAFQLAYIYIYKGKLDDFQVETGKGLGFEVWSIKKLLELSEEDKKKFIPYIYQFTITVLIDFIKNKI